MISFSEFKPRTFIHFWKRVPKKMAENTESKNPSRQGEDHYFESETCPFGEIGGDAPAAHWPVDWETAWSYYSTTSKISLASVPNYPINKANCQLFHFHKCNSQSSDSHRFLLWCFFFSITELKFISIYCQQQKCLQNVNNQIFSDGCWAFILFAIRRLPFHSIACFQRSCKPFSVWNER